MRYNKSEDINFLKSQNERREPWRN